MGADPATIGLILTAVGAGAGAVNTYQTAKNTDQANAAGIRQQASRQREIDQRVSQEVGALERSNADAARTKSTGDFLSALRRTRGAASGGGLVGGSSRYGDESTAVGDQVQGYGADIADTLGRINAPTLQRVQENQGFSRLASDIGATARAANGDQFLNQLRTRAAGQPNAALGLFGELSGVAGQGIAANARPPGTPRPGTPAYNRQYGLR